MNVPHPRFNRPDTLFPYPTLFRFEELVDEPRSMEAGVHGGSALEHDGADLPLAQRACQPFRFRMRSRRDQDLCPRDVARAVLPDHHQSRLIGREPAPRSEEHTSELQSLMRISYAVFCLKKKT